MAGGKLLPELLLFLLLPLRRQQQLLEHIQAALRSAPRGRSACRLDTHFPVRPTLYACSRRRALSPCCAVSAATTCPSFLIVVTHPLPTPRRAHHERRAHYASCRQLKLVTPRWCVLLTSFSPMLTMRRSAASMSRWRCFGRRGKRTHRADELLRCLRAARRGHRVDDDLVGRLGAGWRGHASYELLRCVRAVVARVLHLERIRIYVFEVVVQRLGRPLPPRKLERAHHTPLRQGRPE
mmetsp:Transcript_21350/g.53240  ORF Transcript_21350/g.53240 Transcript_21350/m.53240 type:complete len:238 (-) Transcript_21350:220-933(-)